MGELLILMIAGTVCASVVLAGAGITIVRLVSPDLDVSRAIAALVGTINTLLGLLAGFIAGRNDRGPPRV